MSRLNRCLRIVVLVAAGPAFGQSVTVSLPPPPLPPLPTVRVAISPPHPTVVVQERTVVHETVYVKQKGNRGKHKGQRK